MLFLSNSLWQKTCERGVEVGGTRTRWLRGGSEQLDSPSASVNRKVEQSSSQMDMVQAPGRRCGSLGFE